MTREQLLCSELKLTRVRTKARGRASFHLITRAAATQAAATKLMHLQEARHSVADVEMRDELVIEAEFRV